MLAVVGVLAFLLSAAAGFFVVQRLFAPREAVVAEQTPAKASAKSKASVAKGSTKAEGSDSGALAASDIIQRVNDAYGSLTSYSAEGTVVTDMDMSKVDFGSIPGMPASVAKQAKASKEAQAALAKPQHLESNFSMKLAKPNLYRIDWKSQAPMKSSGAAWSAGDGDYIYMGLMPPKYVKLESRDLVLGAAAGLSQGAAHAVPSFFFNDKQNFLNSLESLALGNDDSVDGSDCYVLTGTLRGLKMNLWIDKSTFLIRQRQQILGGEVKMPEMSDKDVDAALKQMGGGATPEKRAQMKKMMRGVQAMSSKMNGKITETYRNVQTNQKIAATEFKFDVPVGVELSKSLF